jgi:3-isopropylmalate/(R)-2-methylmalate dehydratase small subunit
MTSASLDPRRITVTARAIAVRGNDIDTDRIIPARFLKCVVFDGLGEHAFEDDRLQLKEKGQTHPIDNPRYAGAEVMLVNKNFGCGSSREHAPQAIMRWGRGLGANGGGLGVRAIVGESFAEIFFGNCCALGIPCVTVSEADIQQLMSQVETHPQVAVTVDIDKRQVSAGDVVVACQIADGPRSAFLEGRWDTTFELLDAKDKIAATAAKLPYWKHWQ